jgi:MYXO-CTERM domain-containing protein
MIDAAAAARMSDPDRNPHFRRRWDEKATASARSPAPGTDGHLGPIGLALLEAWRRKRQSEGPQDVKALTNG